MDAATIWQILTGIFVLVSGVAGVLYILGKRTWDDLKAAWALAVELNDTIKTAEADGTVSDEERARIEAKRDEFIKAVQEAVESGAKFSLELRNLMHEIMVLIAGYKARQK